MAQEDGLTEPLLKAAGHGDELAQPILASGYDDLDIGYTAKVAPEVTPYKSAGFINRLLFLWLGPLLQLGYLRPLELKDVPNLGPEEQAETLYTTFAQAWENQKKEHPSETQSVGRALAKSFSKLGILTGLFALLRALSLSAGPIFLRFFIEYTSGTVRFKGEGYVLILCLFIAKMVESFSQRHWLFGCRRLGMQMQSAVIAAVFQKELRLSSIGRRSHSVGEIVNYIAVDAYRLGEFPWYMHYVWTVPLQMILAVIILFTTVGLATLPGVAIILLTIILNSPLARSLQKCQAQFMIAQDQRLRATTEVLNSMKVIKLQAWEDKFRAYIEGLRDVEVDWLSKAQRRRGAGTILYWMSPIIVGSVVFATCIWMKKPLNAMIIFTVLATFKIIQEPVRMVPEVLASVIQVMISLNRLGKFLRDDELPDDGVDRIPDSAEFAVKIEDCTMSWDPESPKPTLRAISLKVRHGQKVAVCGAVGSGKSSLLCAILGEIPKLSGHVQVCGSIAYVSQSAWIQSGTVRDNILFGKPMDKARYKSTLKACALEKDMESFAFGDLTEIGERGLNMSGGQKQRIQLARAVYSDSDIYLLDDPFSAVDAHTAATLFKDCVMGALLPKTVVLVTHQVEFLPAVDCILVMQGGEIKQSGTYDALLCAGETFEQLVNAHQEALTTVSFGETVYTDDVTTLQPASIQRKLTKKASSLADISGTGTQLVQEEEKGMGAMGLKPYTSYITVPKGVSVFVLMTLAQTLFVVFQILSNLWLATGVSSSNVSSGILVAVYAVLSIISGVFVHMRSMLIITLGLKASKAFFYGMNCNVFRAPMSFFDSTPTGRILSRASTDLSVMDLDIPFCFGFVASGALELFGVLIVIALVTWEILIIAVPMLFVVQRIQEYYVKSSRELMRINGTTRAPIVNFAAETIQGASTVRAFQMVERFKNKNLDLIDSDASLYFHNHAAMEWLIQRLEIISNIVLCATGLLLVILPSNSFTPGKAGLALTYALSLSTQQVFFVQWQCKLVNYIVSVERINQYLQLPSEAPAVIENNRPPQHWPSKGRVALVDLRIRYKPNSPLVLRGISCTFEGGQRVGVVGRTGSGKTTLISALFRLVEPASGKIIIDDLDICSIGLHDLRTRLGIIPQEPILFRGTVRTNLDPLSQYTDEEVWEALDRCQLGKEIWKSPLLLDSPVTDEGENWSAGQRQLFCLGRVLLKQSRVLVLDEATASVDSQTDALLQKVIRSEFKNSTVITVAHRIPTVIDSDMVLSLRDGHLIEFDKPIRLLEDENSLFAKLVVEYWSHVSHKSKGSHHASNHLKSHPM